MNIELYIQNQLVELDDQFNVRLNKELYSAEELSNKDVSYSFTVNIPTTQHNREIFNYSDIEEVPNKFGQVYQAELYVNSTLILSGNYINQEIDEDYYSGNLYTPSQKSLKDVFGDLSLDQIAPHNYNIGSWGNMEKTVKLTP